MAGADRRRRRRLTAGRRSEARAASPAASPADIAPAAGEAPAAHPGLEEPALEGSVSAAHRDRRAPTPSAQSGRSSVALIGMMGAGKSTVGSLLAERLGWSFFDTDVLLEAAFERPIAEIFQRRGEAEFRAAERLLVRLFMSLSQAVLATGGGLWIDPVCRRRLASFAYTAYLAAPPETLWKRLQSHGVSERPLLVTDEPRSTLARLLSEREPIYALADWRMEVRASSPERVVQQLLERLRSVGLVGRSGAAA